MLKNKLSEIYLEITHTLSNNRAPSEPKYVIWTAFVDSEMLVIGYHFILLPLVLFFPSWLPH